MATEDAGIVSYDLKSGITKPLMNEKWHYGSITDFVIKGTSFWISSLRRGLIIYNSKSKHVKLFDKASEGFTAINTLYHDHEGNIWAGTKTDVMRTSGDNLEYIEDIGPTQHENVLAVAVDQDDNVWYSTSEGLFKRTVDVTGKVIITPQLRNTDFAKKRIISLYVDRHGFVWAGMYGEGVIRINPDNGKIRHLNKELRNGNILNITGKNDIVWLATLGGGTRIEIRNEDLVIKNITASDGLSSDYIYQIFVDSKNRVWFATDGRGVDMQDDKGFHHFESGLTSKVIFGFAEDANEQLWINVQGEGLLKIDNLAFSSSGIKLRDNNITCLTTDRYGNLVICHELGIDVYNSKKNVLTSRGEEAGMKNRLATLNAFAKDKEGNLFIGTDNGIIKFSGDSFSDLVAPRPFISGLKILNKNVSLSQDLTLQYDHNSVTIEYVGYWFQNPTSLNFRYRLDNYDLDWINSHDRSVTYSSLPPGEYIFRLAVSEGDVFDKSSEAIFRFKIKPPFWRTNLFYLLVGVTLSMLAYSFVRYREKKLQRDNIILEQKVYDRTLEIQRQTEEIQAQNEEISTQAEEIQGINENLELLVKERTYQLEKKNKALEEYAFINAHELRAPVASILGLIDLLVRSESEEEAQAIRNRLKESAEKLNQVVRSITNAIERGDI
jgi:ligand-binding sensor domain-containing protein